MEVLEVGKDGFTFKALVTVRPPFEIGNYKGLTASKEEVEQLALTEQNIVRHLEGLTVRKVVVIPGKLVNVVAN